PGRISIFSSPQHCVQPRPPVTMRVWPQGCVCHAERAPGSNVTAAPPNCAGPGDWKSGSIRTLPVKYSLGPIWDGCEPLRLISIGFPSFRHLLRKRYANTSHEQGPKIGMDL